MRFAPSTLLALAASLAMVACGASSPGEGSDRSASATGCAASADVLEYWGDVDRATSDMQVQTDLLYSLVLEDVSATSGSATVGNIDSAVEEAATRTAKITPPAALEDAHDNFVRELQSVVEARSSGGDAAEILRSAARYPRDVGAIAVMQLGIDRSCDEDAARTLVELTAVQAAADSLDKAVTELLEAPQMLTAHETAQQALEGHDGAAATACRSELRDDLAQQGAPVDRLRESISDDREACLDEVSKALPPA